ncbi:ATP-binding cassette domain-containing protein [Rhizobium leguminosarum]|uniref:ATP-binding cassette domain-containing protein n=1 Tax=Rhizobium leguminosarum TaxID=384 RepID=UPI0021BBCB25|nr:ATP-binding cassette domain-containing protein [Rhizobium leguminosarum]
MDVFFLNTERRLKKTGTPFVGLPLAIGTRGRLDAPTKSLSGGNQQKVLLARIIEQNADLVLLDEPTKGVDIGAKSDIYDIIRRLADEGRCIVVVSSEEQELVDICDRIAIFQHGLCTTEPKPVGEWSLAKLREAAWAPAAA